MSDYNTIKDRYNNNYITDAQLDRYVTLKVITQEQADAIRAEKNKI